MLEHQKMMRRCVQLANSALSTTYPNPMVGCVVVVDNQVIAEGFTSPAGGNHAEVNTINAVPDKGILKQATLYVSLEPCAHYGKTPPCSLAIIEHQIPKVVIGTTDTYHKVAGKGIQMLKDAGIELVIGVEEELCREVNKRFFTTQEQKRPYIILKWAETANGFFASNQPEQKWISNLYSKQLVHQWRAEEHAILVGTNTALIDNPTLTARLWNTNRQPIRILIDRDLKVPETYNLFNQDAETIVFNAKYNQTRKNIEWVQLDFKQNILAQILNILYKKDIQSIIIEGGAKIIEQFIALNLWDEARIIKSDAYWEEGLLAPKLNGTPLAKTIVENDQIVFIGNEKNDQ